MQYDNKRMRINLLCLRKIFSLLAIDLQVYLATFLCQNEYDTTLPSCDSIHLASATITTLVP